VPPKALARHVSVEAHVGIEADRLVAVGGEARERGSEAGAAPESRGKRGVVDGGTAVVAKGLAEGGAARALGREAERLGGGDEGGGLGGGEGAGDDQEGLGAEERLRGEALLAREARPRGRGGGRAGGGACGAAAAAAGEAGRRRRRRVSAREGAPVAVAYTIRWSDARGSAAASTPPGEIGGWGLSNFR
jgi:hypothetical protein